MSWWSRYNQSAEGPTCDVSAHELGAPVTPFSRYPLQDLFYNALVYTHIVCALLYLPTMIWQFLAKKGDQQHLFRGLGLKWLAIPMIGGGWLLQIRHSYLSDPAIFQKHPVLFRLPFAQAFVDAFGSSTLVSTLNVYLIGVKDESRRTSLGSGRYFLILVAASISLCIIIRAYAYMVGELLKLPAWSSYHWEMNVEMAVIGSVFPLYDGLNFFALAMWWKTGYLNYVEHHVMNAVWVMSKASAAVLLFAAHDAQWFWPHPGLILPYRLAVQLGPQLLILLPYMPRILRYITAIPHYEPNAGELRLAEMEFLKKEGKAEVQLHDDLNGDVFEK